MANFALALKKTLEWEGNYSLDPNDTGGETWQGVSRKHHPTWAGWDIIDSLKGLRNFPLCLLPSYSLKAEVEDLYRREYWNVLKCDDIEHQGLAEKLFDIAVNMGIGRAVKFLQQAINTVEERVSLFEDGVLGAKTLLKLKEFVLEDKCERLIATIRVLQANKYERIVAKDPTQQRFLKGWLRRAAV